MPGARSVDIRLQSPGRQRGQQYCIHCVCVARGTTAGILASRFQVDTVSSITIEVQKHTGEILCECKNAYYFVIVTPPALTRHGGLTKGDQLGLGVCTGTA